MEKLIALLIALVLALNFTGCKSEEEKAQERLRELEEEGRELQAALDEARRDRQELEEAFDRLERYEYILGG